MVSWSLLQKNEVSKLLHISLTDAGTDLGGGCKGCALPPPRDDLRFSNTTGILQKKTTWFIGVEVEQEKSAPLPKKILDPPL